MELQITSPLPIDQLVRNELQRRRSKEEIPAPRPVSKEKWPPDYDHVRKWRERQLFLMEERPDYVPSAKELYAADAVKFINHWCDIWEPREAMSASWSHKPFIMFPRQVELAQFVLSCIEDQEAGLVEKSRDMGATWVCVALSVWLWLFRPGAVIGWGSLLAPQVDILGNPSSIFEKMRQLIRNLPKQFLPAGFEPNDHLLLKRCINPETGAAIIGEVGDSIGRGGRTLTYIQDEAAHYVHAEKIEAAISETTRAPIAVSSVNGPGNVFHRRRESGVDWYPGGVFPRGRTRVFVLDWKDHPEKTEEWYQRRKADFEMRGLPHIFAQEVDRNYSAAQEGGIIKPEWVDAAVDAHVKLGFEDDGPWVAALDVADGGGDTNALAKKKGVVLRGLEEWSERDPGLTARRAVAGCRNLGSIDLQYDSIGVGAGVKAETNRLADEKLLPAGLRLVPWMAGAKVLRPIERVNSGDKDSPRNKDFFGNLKAQAWYNLSQRFFRTWQTVTQGVEHDHDDLISIDSNIPLLHKLSKELCQATASRSSSMKLVVDKNPEGFKSPNLADAVVMCYWPVSQSFGAAVEVGSFYSKMVGEDKPRVPRDAEAEDDNQFRSKMLR